jgi:hypothetical protein
MTVGYNKIVAIALLILAVINAILGVWLLLLGSLSSSLIIAVLVGFLAYGYLTRPYVVVEKNQIVLPALIGPVQRTFLFRTPDDVKMEGDKLFVRDGDAWKRVRIYRWVSDPEGWTALKTRFARA